MIKPDRETPNEETKRVFGGLLIEAGTDPKLPQFSLLVNAAIARLKGKEQIAKEYERRAVILVDALDDLQELPPLL